METKTRYQRSVLLWRQWNNWNEDQVPTVGFIMKTRKQWKRRPCTNGQLYYENIETMQTKTRYQRSVLLWIQGNNGNEDQVPTVGSIMKTRKQKETKTRYQRSVLLWTQGNNGNEDQVPTVGSIIKTMKQWKQRPGTNGRLYYEDDETIETKTTYQRSAL